MLELVLASLWFFLPAGIANMAPVIAKKLFGEARPVSARLFGAHKTWRGLIAGTVAGALAFLLQRWLFEMGALRSLALIDYGAVTPLLGAALGFGALAGDMLKSFCKRRIGVAPGKPWIPFDQVDYIVGGILCAMPLVRLPWHAWAIIFVGYALLHVLTNHIAYWTGVRKERF